MSSFCEWSLIYAVLVLSEISNSHIPGMRGCIIGEVHSTGLFTVPES